MKSGRGDHGRRELHWYGSQQQRGEWRLQVADAARSTTSADACAGRAIASLHRTSNPGGSRSLTGASVSLMFDGVTPWAHWRGK